MSDRKIEEVTLNLEIGFFADRLNAFGEKKLGQYGLSIVETIPFEDGEDMEQKQIGIQLTNGFFICYVSGYENEETGWTYEVWPSSFEENLSIPFLRLFHGVLKEVFNKVISTKK